MGKRPIDTKAPAEDILSIQLQGVKAGSWEEKVNSRDPCGVRHTH